jgi:hypothetical protein
MYTAAAKREKLAIKLIADAPSRKTKSVRLRFVL